MTHPDTVWKRISRTAQEAGLAMTPYRRHILKALLRQPGPVSLSVLREGLPEPKPHKVTAYRTVERLQQAGLVKRVRFLDDDSDRYELSDQLHRHHHHAVCERCGRTEPVTGCESILTQLRPPEGFKVMMHQLEFYGFCVGCRQAAA